MEPHEERGALVLASDSIYMAMAAAEADRFEGGTRPNPPVGACVVRAGQVLGVAAHERAGGTHAEIAAMKRAVEVFGGEALRRATLYVTLEPCNHQGKTPPCTGAILESGIRRVVIGARDPNPAVRGGGAGVLKTARLDVTEGVLAEKCERLIAPFRKWALTGRPWLVHKLALRLDDEGRPTMIPPPGEKTFSGPDALREAHLERRRCDAILTGIGTVLSDRPRFDVRNVDPHAGKSGIVAVLSRRGRKIPEVWAEEQRARGTEVLELTDFDAAMAALGERGCHRVLVEAGPTLSRFVEASGAWDERLVIVRGRDGQDLIHRETACSRES